MPEPKLDLKYENQARMLANKVKKTYQHLRKRFAGRISTYSGFMTGIFLKSGRLWTGMPVIW